ncbi:response regulator [Aestuariispira insulae]|uniref:response regulator n=1 Tax=Aestuariispira insulae TaxID=1461337 RepID=UPI0015F26BCE|nr:response regulator [Aestuariispira insulae]
MISLRQSYRGIILFLCLTILGVVGVGVSVHFRVLEISDAWHLYTTARSERFVLLNKLRGDLGFGGMIHKFKNLVLRHDLGLVPGLETSFLNLKRHLEEYRKLGPSAAEEADLRAIELTVSDYEDKLGLLELLIEAGESPTVIDRRVRVSDAAALSALTNLENIAFHIGEGLRGSDRRRLRNLASIRAQLGYGGMIHAFKNYLLRGDEDYLDQARERAVAVRSLVEDFLTLDPTDVEQRHMMALLATVTAYRHSIERAENLRPLGMDISEIDDMVRVDDGAALEALDKLDAAMTLRLQQRKLQVDHSIDDIGGWLAVVLIGVGLALMLLTIFIGYLVKRGMLDPIDRLKEKVAGISGDRTADWRIDLNNPDFISVQQEINGLLDRLQSQLHEITMERDRTAAAMETKSRFVANVSHELRTPLNGIIGMSELLLSSPLTEDQKKLTGMVRQSGEVLKSLVNDILDFSKLNEGKINLVVVPCCITHMADLTISILSDKAAARGTKLEKQIDPDLSEWIAGDEGRITQILLNLCSNAVKFTENGTVTLSFRRRLVEDEEMLEIAVTDNGIGISAINLGRIFDRFEQVEEANGAQVEGTGLGLSIVGSLVELMGGTLGAKSEEGKGSHFTVTIPYRPCKAPVVSAGAAQSNNISVPPRKILVVEDNEINTVLIQRILEADGHMVETCSDGAQAVKAAQENSYDIILMDVQMPVMDGLEATRQIRALPNGAAGIPIVGVTANVMEDDRQVCALAGMNTIIAKPIEQAHLRQALADFAIR